MKISTFRQSRALNVFVGLQIAVLLIYLNANIVNVGEMGAGLSILLAFVFLSVMAFVFLSLKRKLYVRLHLLFFLTLILWIAFRVIMDLGDLEYLKQITVATTGGMLLFYVVGFFLGTVFQSVLLYNVKLTIEKIVILFFTVLLVWMLYNFSYRLYESLFFLKGVDGGYQRPGNFLSISFIIVSFLYVNLILKRINVNGAVAGGIFWLGIYTCSTLMSLVGSQLFGSNSATAVILGVYLITLVMTLIIPRKSMWQSYLSQKLALPWSKRLLKQLSVMSILGVVLFIVFLVSIINITNFDILSLRLLGFGSGTNTSLLSRIHILLESGVSQMGYAPFFGNINVAYLTTGNAGRTLHSFFPYVMANLGLVGLTIVLVLFGSVFVQLYRESKKTREVGLHGYQSKMIALYSMFILFYMIFFANLATGVSWLVLWFTLGFVSKPFGFSERV